MKTNWLANIFLWFNDVVQAADRPISQVVMVLLPFIAPILPALITARSLQIYMNLPPEWTWIGVVAFEFIGYLGMISTVGALMTWIKNENNTRNWSNVVLSGTAYGFYLLALILTNLILELVNGVPGSHVAVTACLTVGLSVAASLLNGQRIFDRSQDEKKEKELNEKRNYALERYRIKHGVSGSHSGSSKSTSGNTRGSGNGSGTTSGSVPKMGRHPIHQERVFSYLDQKEKSLGRAPTFSEVFDSLKLPASTVSRLRNEWLALTGK